MIPKDQAHALMGYKSTLEVHEKRPKILRPTLSEISSLKHISFLSRVKNRIFIRVQACMIGYFVKELFKPQGNEEYLLVAVSEEMRRLHREITSKVNLRYICQLANKINAK